MDLFFAQLSARPAPRSTTVAVEWFSRVDASLYDAVHRLVRAMSCAGSADRERIGDALEQLSYPLSRVKPYRRFFTTYNHEALSKPALRRNRFREDGVVVPR